MNITLKIIAALSIAAMPLLPGCSGCDDKDNNPVNSTPPPSGPAVADTADIFISVRSSLDSGAIPGANVVLYSADNNAPLTRAFTDTAGRVVFRVDSGNYFVKISAPGFRPSPPDDYTTPLPFAALAGDTLDKDYYLFSLPASADSGTIFGWVYRDTVAASAALSGILVLARDTAADTAFSSVSGPDGYFVFYNLPAGSYGLYAYRAGYLAHDTAFVKVLPDSANDSLRLTLNPIQGAALTGKVTFLSITNGIVDVSLLDSATFSAIPGLFTFTSSDTNLALDYSLDSIPPGRYLAWASFRNDGYVMDPDWIFKFGLPMITLDTVDTQMNFSVTRAMTIYSPTNPDSLVIPVMADSTVPTFKWKKYSSAKQYIILVTDLSGNRIWGGYNPDGVIHHAFLGQQDTSAAFNFDNTADTSLIPLTPGETYQWRIYADDDDAAGVQTLISSSEDLKGLFQVPGD